MVKHIRRILAVGVVLGLAVGCRSSHKDCGCDGDLPPVPHAGAAGDYHYSMPHGAAAPHGAAPLPQAMPHGAAPVPGAGAY